MSTEYTHFTNLAFDNLFARGPDGAEVQIFSSSGAFSWTKFTASNAGTALAPSLGITDGASTQGLYLPSTGNIGIAVSGTKILNINSTGLQITGTVSATNFSGTSSGTNTGDVTIGTANGLSLVSQAISMAPASSSAIGVVTTGTQSFAGTKTFVTPLTGSNIAPASSSASGVVSTGTQSFAGTKTFVTPLTGANVAPASSSASGVVSTGTQSFAGTKTFVTPLTGSNVASASSSASGVVSTGTQGFAGTKTFVGQLIGKGTAAINDAAAGYIGEFITAESSGISAPTSTQYGDVTNITLTAGDWDISVNGEGFLNTATGLTVVGMGIGTVSGNSSTGQVAGINFHSVLPPTSVYNSHVTIANYRISINASTIYYLKMLATYSGGSPQFRGRISARRIR